MIETETLNQEMLNWDSTAVSLYMSVYYCVLQSVESIFKYGMKTSFYMKCFKPHNFTVCINLSVAAID
jgi:hypothetical protein